MKTTGFNAEGGGITCGHCRAWNPDGCFVCTACGARFAQVIDYVPRNAHDTMPGRRDALNETTQRQAQETGPTTQINCPTCRKSNTIFRDTCLYCQARLTQAAQLRQERDAWSQATLGVSGETAFEHYPTYDLASRNPPGPTNTAGPTQSSPTPSSSFSSQEMVCCPDCGEATPFALDNCASCGSFISTNRALREERRLQRLRAKGVSTQTRRPTSSPGSISGSPASGGSQFLRQTPEQIRAEATSQLQQEIKSAQSGCGTPGSLVGCAFGGLWIPIIGWFITAVCLMGAIITAIQGFSRPRVDPQLLAGLCHNLRHMTKGPCPICQDVIWITPEPGQTLNFPCPTCHGNLHYDGRDTVTPA